MQNRIVRFKELQQKLGLSKSTVYGMIKRGDLPKPMQIGARAVGWLDSELDEVVSTWMSRRDSHEA